MRRRVAQHRLWSEATGADGSEAEGGAEDKLGSAMFFLILAIVVVLFGLGVVVVNRRRERRLSLERARPPTKRVEKPPPEVLEPEAAAPDLAEPEVDEAEDLEELEEVAELEELAPPRFRDRLGKARAALGGRVRVGPRA